MELLGVGAPEALVILVITLIVVGPQRFPEIARQGGRYYRMARRYAAEVTEDVRGAMEELETEIKEQTDQLKDAHDQITESVTNSMDETREELEAFGRSTEQILDEQPAPKIDTPASSNGSGALLAPRELPADEDEDAVRGGSD